MCLNGEYADYTQVCVPYWRVCRLYTGMCALLERMQIIHRYVCLNREDVKCVP